MVTLAVDESEAEAGDASSLKNFEQIKHWMISSRNIVF